MKKYLKYLVVGLVGLVMQGCTYKVISVDANTINDPSEYMMANQDIDCQKAVQIPKNSIYKIYRLPEDGIKTSVYRGVTDSGSGQRADINTLFLKVDLDSSRAKDRCGFLIFPNGEFAFDGKVQYGCIGKEVKSRDRMLMAIPIVNVLNALTMYARDKSFIFQLKCDWQGKTPFEPLTQEKLEQIKQGKLSD